MKNPVILSCPAVTGGWFSGTHVCTGCAHRGSCAHILYGLWHCVPLNTWNGCKTTVYQFRGRPVRTSLNL